MIDKWKAAATALLFTFFLTVLPGQAAADCIMTSPTEHVANAAVIMYGKVTAIDERSQETYFTVTPEQVYKGTPGNPIIVRSDSGRNRVSTVDYHMKLNESHTLYLRPDDKYYTTNACTGSHPGPVRDDEAKLLGAGQPAPPPDPAAQPFEPRPWVPIIAVAVALGAFGVVLLSIRRRRKEQ